MKNFFKIKKSFLIVPVLILSFGAAFSTALLASANEKVDYNQDYLTMGSVEEMYLAYNIRVNDLFNDAFKKTLKGEGVVEVSEDEAEQNELCTNRENIAAFCIGARALYEYRGYDEAMTAAKQSTKITLFKDQTKAKQQYEAFDKEGAKDNFINRELGRNNEPGRALDAQESTLDFYTEFMGAYQMHLSNEELITALAAYNEKLAEVRTETYELAPQFHNVTTDGGSCT